ncbi:hypothetical protein DID75_04310 [Candidatus Marinamargulisbacteria bacterium SCGC AG-410-N11]|nr:hypothetical protein DID75_04310 [Candidatus Marinamargulisbacteria bacterium SCGC AG-410-N11]
MISKKIVLFVVTLVLSFCLVGFTKWNLLHNILFNGVANYHYNSPVKLDDYFSKTAFKLYIERLDPNKQFLFDRDFKILQKYELIIDDQLKYTTDSKLFSDSITLIEKRRQEVRSIYEDILRTPIDFSSNQRFETDPEKRGFFYSKEHRYEFWKNWLGFQVKNEYLDLLEKGDETSTENVSLDDSKDNDKEQKDIVESEEKDSDEEDDIDYSKPFSEAEVKLSEIYLTKIKKVDPVIYEKAVEKVKKDYELYFSRLEKATIEEKREVFMNCLMNVYDMHTSFFSADRKEDFDISISGKLEGIGAVLREDGGFIKVVRIIPGGAAWREGSLKADDVILKVAQKTGSPVDIVGSRVRDAVKLIRGEKGSLVKLHVKHATGKKGVISIIRDIVEIDETYAKYQIIEDSRYKKQFGYIHLPKFYRDFNNNNARNSAGDVEKAIRELTTTGNIQGLILDLRNNSGGALVDAVDMAGLFFSKGPVVQIRGQQNMKHVLSDKNPRIQYAGPLIVMINNYSASASEILAAALQDMGRAVVVGSEQSYGKGTVQTFLELDSFGGKIYPTIINNYLPLGSLKLTIQKFYRINGGSTQERGVQSDIVLPNRFSYLEVGERFSDQSMKWDKINSLRYSRWYNDVMPLLSELRVASRERVKNSDVFNIINSHVSFLKDRRDETKISLKLSSLYMRNKSIDYELKQFEHHFKELDYLSVIDIEKLEDPNVDKESHDKWHEKLKKDVYLSESISILNDLVNVLNRETKE